ncbi:integrin-linked protein kinase 1 [Rosa chinensis]|uniref:integrin-linked protein kinase 1 n=1 Tax=Rosa chinensis TaxID=74649 RepID=UPI001AD8A19B|nr:integrin-linked protein kinase 1 [Rosa chinensis]
MEDCIPTSSLSSKKPKKFTSEGPYRLLYCSSKGDKAGVEQELEKGVEPNLGDYDKRTALHLASCEGCTEIVVLLLQKGANVNCTDRWGRTPLSDARSFAHDGICKILEARGGIDPVGLDSQLPCYEISYKEVNMDEATLIGEELALWQQLRHPNIVQFLGVMKHPDRLIFLTEFLCNGSLHDILKRKGRLDLKTVVGYALDIARGMNYLHQHKPRPIIHRDLTPRNVLQDEAGRLKVTDFGLSKIAQHNDVSGYKMTGRTGSYRYMAPEVYRRESYGKSIDIFSFALLVHEMFLGGPPNLAEDPEQIADKRAYEDSRPPLYSYLFPEPIRKLLKECWHPNPDCRPTFEEIIVELESIQGSIQDSFHFKKRLGTCNIRCVIS